MEVKLQKQEAKFVEYVLGIMRSYKPRELNFLGFKKSDIPVVQKGTLILSQNPVANNNLVESIETVIDHMGDDAPSQELDAAYAAFDVVKAAVNGR